MKTKQFWVVTVLIALALLACVVGTPERVVETVVVIETVTIELDRPSGVVEQIDLVSAEETVGALCATDSLVLRQICAEATLVYLHTTADGVESFTCAGNGLVRVLQDNRGAGTTRYVVPNVGDWSMRPVENQDGGTVALKLAPAGAVFIPRWPNQIILMDGQARPEITLAEGLVLMEQDRLIWTARDTGPMGNGHGIAGLVAACDPQFVTPTTTP